MKNKKQKGEEEKLYNKLLALYPSEKYMIIGKWFLFSKRMKMENIRVEIFIIVDYFILLFSHLFYNFADRPFFTGYVLIVEIERVLVWVALNLRILECSEGRMVGN